MRCHSHPSMQANRSGQCFLCPDQMPYIPPDSRKFQYAQMSGGKHTTKRAYQQDLKRRGMTDDIGHKEMMQAAISTSKREQHLQRGIERMTEQVVKGFKYGQPIRTEQQHQLMSRLKAVFGQPRRG